MIPVRPRPRGSPPAAARRRDGFSPTAQSGCAHHRVPGVCEAHTRSAKAPDATTTAPHPRAVCPCDPAARAASGPRGAAAGAGGYRVLAAVSAAMVAAAVAGCGADPPLPSAPLPDPPAACVLNTTALTSATDVTWTPDQSTANDTRCVYDAGPAPASPGGPAFLTVSLFPRTQADPAAERELLAQLCRKGSRVDVDAADGGFVCRFDGDLVYGVLVRGDQVVQVAASAIPASTASATLASAISDQLAHLPSG